MIMKTTCFPIRLAMVLLSLCFLSCSKVLDEIEKDKIKDYGLIGHFGYNCTGTFKGKYIEVYYYIPRQGKVTEMPIQFVIHGNSRNAFAYRDSWKSIADELGIVVIAPEFDTVQFPNIFFQSANIIDEKGNVNDEDQYTYQIIDQLFLKIKKDINSNQSTYNIYGHSAGAQFVHRMMMFHNCKYVDKIVAANAGVYTFPNERVDFPYGIMNYTKNKVFDYNKVFQKSFVLMLSLGDTIRDSSLNKTIEADAEGKNRLERGNSFFYYSDSISQRRNCKFNWTCHYIEGGHSCASLVPTAAKLLYSVTDIF